jgi:hypothetical protein
MTDDDDEKARRKASSNGGKKRAANLTPERRTEIAQHAALTRHVANGSVALAKYGAPDRPLRIGSVEIPAYVLADGRRVLAQRGLQRGIGLSEGGGKGGARRIVALMTSLAEKGIDVNGLSVRADSPIRFILPHGGKPAEGYEATILPDICAVLIEAGRQGKLQPQQAHLAEQCAVLQHGFAIVGIIALVDEATGYQDYRARDALAKIIEKFVAKELRPWVPTFPPEFYKQIYRLNGWDYRDGSSARPGVIGHWTTNIVYKRLAPGVWQELNARTPRYDNGRLKHKLFQLLTDDWGDPRLREHFTGVVMLMKYAPDWRAFIDRLDKEYPQWGSTLMLPFPDDYTPPDLPTSKN